METFLTDTKLCERENTTSKRTQSLDDSLYKSSFESDFQRKSEKIKTIESASVISKLISQSERHYQYGEIKENSKDTHDKKTPYCAEIESKCNIPSPNIHSKSNSSNHKNNSDNCSSDDDYYSLDSTSRQRRRMMKEISSNTFSLSNDKCLTVETEKDFLSCDSVTTSDYSSTEDTHCIESQNSEIEDFSNVLSKSLHSKRPSTSGDNSVVHNSLKLHYLQAIEELRQLFSEVRLFVDVVFLIFLVVLVYSVCGDSSFIAFYIL